MNLRKYVKQTSGLLVFAFGFSGIAQAGIPDVTQIMVTDVTTRSFSVIWAASESSTADLGVYEDEAGLFVLSTANIIAHPIISDDSTIKETAENNGVMKVQVTGLEPATTYYFSTITTSKSSSDTVSVPESDPLLSVTTENITVRTADSGDDLAPFSNDVIIQPCYLGDNVTPAEGTLLLASVEGANYPLTAFVGDGVDLPDALIDLNNVFGVTSHQNIDLSQGENLTLLNFRGLEGNSIITYEVPLDNSLTEVKPPANFLESGWNMVSLQLDPVNPDAATVLDPILDKVSSIWAYDVQLAEWVSFTRGIPGFLNSLHELHSSVGYWVNLDDAVSVPVQNGSFAEGGIALTTGWNLVGYSSISTLPVLDAISSIGESLVSIWTVDSETSEWKSYVRGNPPFLNSLNVIQPGVSYWINVSDDVVWY